MVRRRSPQLYEQIVVSSPPGETSAMKERPNLTACWPSALNVTSNHSEGLGIPKMDSATPVLGLTRPEGPQSTRTEFAISQDGAQMIFLRQGIERSVVKVYYFPLCPYIGTATPFSKCLSS